MNDKNESRLHELDILIGNWDLTMTSCWFLESLDTKVKGWASFEWIEDAFVLWKWHLTDDNVPEENVNIIGYSSATNKMELFYTMAAGYR